MAINKDYFKRDFQAVSEELPKYDKGAARYRLNTQLFHYLGINERKTEKGVDENNTPRIYEMTAEGELKDPFADGSTINSDSFLDKLAQNKILMFPSGEKYPVQMRFRGSDYEYSRPLENLPVPEPRKPTLSGWKRFANAITFGAAYRKDKAEYDQKLAEYPSKLEKWRNRDKPFQQLLDKRTPEVLARETEQYEAEVAHRDEEERQAKLEAERKEVQKSYDDLQHGKLTAKVDVYRNTLKEYYGPTPVFHEEFCGTGADKSYKKEQFDQLQDYAKSVEGSGISADEFTALSMFKTFDPEIGGKYDPEGSIGLTPEESVATNMSMFTDTVNGNMTRPRASHGKVFGWVVEPARKKTAEAIEEYKQGNPEKLGELIGLGMHTLANHYAGQEMGNEHFLSITSMMGDALGLLERDPKLRAEAEKTMTALAAKDNPEATPKELKATVKRGFDLANGQRVALDLTHKNEKAKLMLHAESLGICKLTPEQRKECIDDRLVFETVRENTKIDVFMQHKSEAYLNKSGELTVQVAMTVPPKDGATKEQLIAKNRANAAFNSFENDSIRAPKAVVKMGRDKLAPKDLVAGRLQNTEKLYTLSGKELEDALKEENLLAMDSPYMKKDEDKTVTQEKVKTQEKTVVKTQDKVLGG